MNPPFEPVNLDCCTIDPNDLDRMANALELYAEYAKTLAQAMRHRKAGSIASAALLENQCDAIYRNMPAWARW